MIKFKEYWLLILPYFSICSGIYHITYWNEFNLNGLEIISLSDLVITSVQPLVNLIGVDFFAILSAILITAIKFKINTENINKESKSESKSKINDFFLKYILIFILSCIPLLVSDNIRFLYIILLAPTYLFYELGLLKKLIPIEQFRGYVIFLIMFFPMESYIIGKIRSKQIKDNIDYNYTMISDVKYKIIGINDNFLISTDTNNQTIYYFKLTNFNSLELIHKNK